MHVEGIHISRPVDQTSLEAIDTLAKDLMHTFPSAGFIPREPEALGQTLIERGECRLTAGSTGTLKSGEHYSQFFTRILEKSAPPTAFDTLNLPIVGVQYLGRNSLRDAGVALILGESDVMASERDAYTKLLNKVSKEPLIWKDLIPHITIGQIGPERATSDLVEWTRERAKSIGMITLTAIHTSKGPLLRPRPAPTSVSRLNTSSVRDFASYRQPNSGALQTLRMMGTRALNN